MNKEQKFFLQIMRDHIHKSKTVLVDVDYSILASYASSHQLSPIIYYQCKENVPMLQKSYLQQISHFSNRNHVLAQVKIAMAGIPYFLVKGTVIAYLYPVPALRTMGDVDLIVHEQDIEKTKQVLVDNGFTLGFESILMDERNFSKNGIHIEIHTHLIRKDQGDIQCGKFFDSVWDYVENNTIDLNFHFLFLVVHLRSHFASHGVGFRQFLDIAIISQKIELDWQWIEIKADEIGLLKFMKIVLGLNERWFGVSSPLCTDISDEFYESATDEIFNNGVFGDQSNESVPKQVIVSGKKGILSRITFMFNSAFPQYERMVRLPYCSYVRKSKALLPIAWVHRGIYRLSNKERRDNFFSRTVSSKDEMARLESWGVL